MTKVIFIKQKGSIIISSIIDYFRTNGYQTEEVSCNAREIKNIPLTDSDCVIVYAESSLALRTEALVMVKDKIFETKAMLVMIEGDEGYMAVKEMIPDSFVSMKFMHPLDAKTIGPAIVQRMQYRVNRATKKVMVVDDSAVMLTLAKSWLFHS